MATRADRLATAAAPLARDRERFVEMMRLRYWQHLLNEMLKRNEFKIPVHMAFGHEAAAVAMDHVMAPDDVLCLSHRNVAYNLARSKSLAAVLAHLRLEEQASVCGRMGSMNLATQGTSIVYSSSILGNAMAVAAGIAMNRALNKRPGIVFVNIGDGGIEEGAFWETLIFARSHSLRMVVLLENNDFSMSSTIAERRSPIDLERVCAGLGVGYRRASGAVLHDAHDALQAARSEAQVGAPVCVELDITTFNQHAGPTPGWATDPLRIALEDGLLLEATEDDPLFHVQRLIGDAEFARLCDQIANEGRHG